MDLHNEYMSVPTVDLGFHLEPNSDPPSFLGLHKTIRNYNALICDNKLDLAQARSFRCLLCYQYQKAVELKSFPRFNDNQTTDLKVPRLSQLATLDWFSTLDCKIFKDIMILESVLFSRATILQSFESINLDEDSNSNLLEIVLSSIRLCLHLKIEGEELSFGRMKKMSLAVTRCFEIMITRLSQANFLQTAKTLKLCLETFGYRNTFEQIWATVLNRLENENVLNLLCFLTGNCLPEDDQLLRFFYDPALWSFYLKNINNPVPMKRKQANFMISKTLSMGGTMDEPDILKGYDVVPFVHDKDNSGNTDPETLELKQLFLLTLDALEETQKQFALQAVAHLGKMISHPKRHRLGIVWLKVLFQRALTHDSRTVVFQALVQALKLDLQFYQDEMLSTVCRSLNEVRFYATEEMLHKLDLVSWVQRLELGSSGIVPRLVQLISEENLNLVATFHLVDALRRVDQVTEFWSESTVQALMNVVRKNQPLQLNPIHFELERCALQLVMKFVKDRDLVVLSDPLSFLLKKDSNCNSHQQVFNWLVADESDSIDRIISYINSGMSGKSTLSVSTFSTMLDVLFRSAGCSNSLILNQTLDAHFSLLQNLSCRPYCDVNQVYRLVELVSVNEVTRRRLMSRYNTDITQFILQRCLDVKNLDLDQMMVLINYERALDLPQTERQADFDMIVKQTTQILEKDSHPIDSLQYPFLVGLLGVCVAPTTKNQAEIVHLILKIYKIKPDIKPDDPIRDRIFSFFYQSLLRVMLTCATSHGDTKISDTKILDTKILDSKILDTKILDIEMLDDKMFEAALFLLQCVSRKNTPLALTVLGEVISNLKCKNKNHELIKSGEIIKICWKATLDCKKSAYFRPAADQTTRIIGQLANYPGLERLDTLNQVVEEMLRQGDKVPELKISLLRGLDRLGNETIRTKIMLDCHVHGDVLRQDQIIEIELCNNLFQLLSGDHGELLKSYMNFNLDAMVRLRSFAMIDTTVGFEYLMLLLNKAKGLNNKRYFHNSLVHRTYLRILQTILLNFYCTPFENQQQVDTFFVSVSEVFLYGNHQTSVCMLLEWILTLTCVRFEKARPKIWDMLNLVKKEKPNSVQSILRVIYNLFRSLNKEEREHYAELNLAAVFTFCMDQNFSTRLHSQFIFNKIYESCDNVRDKFKLVADAVDKNLQSSDNGAALFSAMEHDFYLTEFNPRLHCNPECILYDIPRLTHVCSSEYQNRNVIRDVFSHKNHNCEKNKDSAATTNLEHIEATKKSHQQFDQDIDCGDDLTNAQKKMMPWKSSLNGEKSDGGLIVVASFVERVPNLGGIARTCEIFGAEKLVISNIEHVKNKEFLNLSVSAEKWLQIDQVKPNELVEYILRKKKDQYTIIGAEQTVNSVNLKDLTWPKNTVLILGHEKSGIPADVIPILDECVEIPQLGIIRSLNVHVSAALCIWQYVVNNLL